MSCTTSVRAPRLSSQSMHGQQSASTIRSHWMRWWFQAQLKVGYSTVTLLSNTAVFVGCGEFNPSMKWLTPREVQQESPAIAKMTVRCALYMDALKNFGSPWLRPRLLFPKLLMTVVVIDRMKVHQMAHVGVSQSRGLKLFGREIIFEEFQPMWLRYLNVTDRQTDRRTDNIRSQYRALH